mgnify:CR=1 FL=1
MAAGDLNKTPSYTENVPVSLGYSDDLSGASGVVKIVIVANSTSTYYGRFTTTISTTTASTWDTETQTWTVEGTLAECNVAMNDLSFEPARGISSNPVYTISCYEDGSSSTALGHTSTITFAGSLLVPLPVISSTSTTNVSYSLGTRTKVSLPSISHAGNPTVELQLRLRRHTNDPEYDATDLYLPKRSDYVTHSSGPLARQEWTDYGYLDTRVYAGNKRPEIYTGNLHSVAIGSAGAGYVQAPKVTISSGTTVAITFASSTGPVVVTSAGHPFNVGNRVEIENAVGMTQLNGNTYTISSKATDTFTLSGTEDGATYTTYVSGGTATVAGSGGTGGEVTATVSGGAITALTIKQTGRDYPAATLTIASTSYDFGATLPVTGAATATAIVSDDYVWSFTGTIAECNQILDNIYYVPYDSSFNKTVYIEMRVNDGTNLI